MSGTLRGPLGAIIVAAGVGARFGDPAKALALLADRPLLEYAVRLITRDMTVDQIVVVLGEHTLAEGAMLLASLLPRDASIALGGATRTASVRAGLDMLDPAIQIVVIHDVARPLASLDLLRRAVAAARIHGAAVPAISVTDTIIEVNTESRISAVPDRSSLRAVQTPQVARRDWLEQAFAAHGTATDEGSVLHLAGYPVMVIEGSHDNIKITHQSDLALAEALLLARAGAI